MAKKLFGGKETYKEELAEAKAIKSGKITPEQYAKGEQSEGVHKMKRGGCVKKAGGGAVTMPKKEDMGSMNMKKGGMCKMTRGGGVATKGVGRGTVVKMAKGGGVEVKGKTRGKMC